MGLFDFDLRSFLSQISPSLDVTREVFFSFRAYKSSVANGIGAQLAAALFMALIGISYIVFIFVIMSFLPYTLSAIESFISLNYFSLFLLNFLLIFIFGVPLASIVVNSSQPLILLAIIRPLIYNKEKQTVSILNELINGFLIFIKTLIKNLSSIFAIGVYLTILYFIYLFVILVLYLPAIFVIYLLPISLVLSLVVAIYAISRINTSILLYVCRQINNIENSSEISNNGPLIMPFNKLELDYCYIQGFKDYVGNYFVNFILIQFLISLVLNIILTIPVLLITTLFPFFSFFINLSILLFLILFYSSVYALYVVSFFIYHKRAQSNKSFK
ncbi:MAG: hypothetical protein N3E37_01115 [Candidatus Micrarchaeota archaeon]|nr:hypothetical protein [Candidatus Micrarchaeota archaeon]